MDHFAGLDVSVKDTSVCIVDDTGKIIRDRRNRFCTLPKHGFRQATCFDPIIGAMMLKALVDEHKLLGQFRHECRLLRSLSGGICCKTLFGGVCKIFQRRWCAHLKIMWGVT
jgi:hypothetical protein